MSNIQKIVVLTSLSLAISACDQHPQLDYQADVNSYIQAQQRDPEQFGQLILDAEVTQARLASERAAAQQTLDTLKQQNAAASMIQVAQTKVNQADRAFNEQNQHVQVLLFVAGLNSPE